MYRPTNPQSSLFEVDAVLPDALPKDDWSFLYREKVLPLIDEEAFRPLYAESGGRPNAPIKAMVSLLIFMGLEKLAWRAAEYLFPRRLDWMIATHTAPKPVFVICVKTTLMFGAPGIWRFGRSLPSGSSSRMMRYHLDITSSFCFLFHMRTTINIDEDLLRIARSLARARSISIGAIISELMRRGLEMQRQPAVDRKSGFPVFQVPRDAHPITLEDVKKGEDEP